jgi:hypothetical protein
VAVLEFSSSFAAAAASGRLLDRDIAMQKRIDLIRTHLSA